MTPEVRTIAQSVATLTPGGLVNLAGDLARIQRLIDIRLTGVRLKNQAANAATDRMLTAEEAAQRLGMDLDQFKRMSRTFPFTVPLNRKTIRYSEMKLARYIKQGRG